MYLTLKNKSVAGLLRCCFYIFTKYYSIFVECDKK